MFMVVETRLRLRPLAGRELPPYHGPWNSHPATDPNTSERFLKDPRKKAAQKK